MLATTEPISKITFSEKQQMDFIRAQLSESSHGVSCNVIQPEAFFAKLDLLSANLNLCGSSPKAHLILTF
ncbi:hypothetical protein F0562_009544 [Nyssa sinensis]|uniref:Uncharacterized protein n=1 Tax=Nyssa sinensis TaxID=561372 RepID=A0A5J5A183_9ASTE|nr:hypothetical protein F0562_009544 [Nyssa sinensis]